MSTLQIIISGALALALSGLSIVCCYIFGCHLAPGEEGQLYGVLGGTADALKAVLPLGVAAALTSGQKARAAIGIVLFVVFSVYSFASELGLYALGRDAQSSGAAAGREQYQTLKGERALIKDRLAELGQTRPAKTVTSELAGQKQSRSWESSGNCKDAWREADRTFCKAVAKLDGELAQSRRTPKTTGSSKHEHSTSRSLCTFILR